MLKSCIWTALCEYFVFNVSCFPSQQIIDFRFRSLLLPPFPHLSERPQRDFIRSEAIRTSPCRDTLFLQQGLISKLTLAGRNIKVTLKIRLRQILFHYMAARETKVLAGGGAVLPPRAPPLPAKSPELWYEHDEFSKTHSRFSTERCVGILSSMVDFAFDKY